MLRTVGINRDVEFFYLHPRPPIPHTGDAVYRTYGVTSDTASTLRNILQDFSFRTGYENAGRDAALLAQEIDLYTWPLAGIDRSYTIDVVRAVFYRNKEAYIVGRIVTGAHAIPMIIPLANGESGIYAETILLHESDASIVFSFAYSYFFVDVERYDALIEFLQSIIPSADLAELYTSLGYNRHGKTIFYRELHRFVHVSKEQFVVAPGLEGAVMIAFTLPNYGFVLKVIKDGPCLLRSMNQTPKRTTMKQVRLRYDFVSHRDRAGRMVDTQEFENLLFRKSRFSDSLLRELEQAATRNVTIADEYVIMRSVYVQRRVAPLPLYFTGEKNPETLRHVLIDFGYFLKDIAASGVFPGDLFNTWNYGVTHWGRVVLYDYDDVLPMEEVTFREKPLPRNDLEETSPEEDWICVTGEDFFMDEIERYSGIPQPLRGVFKSVHGDLYTLAFWKTLIEKLNKGEIFDVIPYDRTLRFRDWGRR
jgi:isocitrate dehydrogenase kinase/phosphatase